MNVSPERLGAVEDAAEGNVTESSRSPVTPPKCRAPSWTNLLLCAIILCVVLLLLFPLMVYYLPRDDQASNLNSLSCSPLQYNGSTCLLELHEWQSCLSDRQNGSDVHISADMEQSVQEEKLQMLLAGLWSLHPSEDCMRAFRSFWCLTLFGLCDGSGQRRLPSYEECVTLQTKSCAMEKQITSGIPELAPLFQECEAFRLNTPVCRNENGSREPLPINVTCSDQFYFDETSMLCKPECGVWTQHSQTTAQTINAFLIIGDVSGVLICTAVSAVSFYQRKRMFKFPSVIILYQSTAILLISALDLLRYVPESELVCSSKDLIESLNVENSTFLCKFLAGLFLYVVLTVGLFWLSHTLMFFWGVVWPLHYWKYTNSGKVKYVHVTTVAVSLLLPVISILACHLSEGYGLSVLAYYKCDSRGVKDTFYAVIVPLGIILSIGTSLLVYIIWIIACVKSKGTTNKRKLTAAEIKLMIVIVYFIIMAVYNITVATIALWRAEAFENEVTEHFACEALGNTGQQCSKDNFNKFDGVTNTILYVWFCSLYPLIFFIFIINCTLKPCRTYASGSKELS